MIRFIFLTLSCFLCFVGFSQKEDLVLYKKVDTTSLRLQVLFPHEMNTSKQYPCIVFFFGGGWKTGSIRQFSRQADYLAGRGMVCFLVDYRIQSRQGTTPFE